MLDSDIIRSIIFLTLIFFSRIQVAFGQTYLVPHFGISNSKINQNQIDVVYEKFANNSELSKLLGLDINHSVLQRLDLQMGFQFERISIKQLGYCAYRENGVEKMLMQTSSGSSFRTQIYDRFKINIGLQFNIVEGLNFSYKNNLSYTPYFILKDDVRNIRDASKVDTREFEMAHHLDINYLLNNVYVSIFYHHGYWKNDQKSAGQIESIRSLGLKIGYQFKVRKRRKD